MSEPTFPETFVVQRDEDVSGVSGEGVIAEGCRFSDGWVVTHWLDQPPMNEPKTDVWHHKGTEPFRKVHGHGGRTRLLWADEVAAARRKHLAAVVEAFDVPAEICGTEAEAAYWREELTRALTAEHGRRASEQIVASPEEHCAGFADAVMPLLANLMQQRNRARATVGRAYKLADSWQGAHGAAEFVVRAAGAELRDELDGAGQRCGEECAEGHVYAGRCEQARPDDLTDYYAPDPPIGCLNLTQAAPGTPQGIRGLLEHVGVDTCGCDITVAGRVVDAALPPAVECSAQYYKTNSGPARRCIRAAQHSGDHIDDRGFHWPDIVAVYPVVGGEPQHSRAASSCSNPDHACARCGNCVNEDPGDGGCADNAPDIRADNSGPTILNHQVNEGESADSEPDTVTDPAWLREQYYTVMREVFGDGPWAVIASRAADEVIRVRDRHVEQLRQRLSLASAEFAELQARDTPTWRHRAEHTEAALAEAQQLVSMLRQLIGAERRIVSTAMGHRDDQGVRVVACDGCGRDHMAELETEIREADKAYAEVFPYTADGPARPGRLPESAARTPRQRAYEAVNAYIEGLGDRLPTTRSARTAHIWLAVNLALDAAGHGAASDEAKETADNCGRTPHEQYRFATTWSEYHKGRKAAELGKEER